MPIRLDSARLAQLERVGTCGLTPVRYMKDYIDTCPDRAELIEMFRPRCACLLACLPQRQAAGKVKSSQAGLARCRLAVANGSWPMSGHRAGSVSA